MTSELNKKLINTKELIESILYNDESKFPSFQRGQLDIIERVLLHLENAELKIELQKCKEHCLETRDIGSPRYLKLDDENIRLKAALSIAINSLKAVADMDDDLIKAYLVEIGLYKGIEDIDVLPDQWTSE